LRCGLERIRRDVDTDKHLAALKMALLTHYLCDTMSVSHTWLDFFGDETDFEFDERHAAIKHFHDPVENRVPELVVSHEAQRSGVVPSGDGTSLRCVPDYERCFFTVYQECLKTAYALGKQVFDAYFAALNRIAPQPSVQALTPPLEPLDELQRRGLANSCRAVCALWEFGVRDGGEGLPFDERYVLRWTLKPLLDWSADDLRGPAFQKEVIAGFQRVQGWAAGDIFRAHDRCSPQALEELALWQRQRDEWRAVAMAGLLPPRPKKLIPAHWRP